jgi:hypothetical protein
MPALSGAFLPRMVAVGARGHQPVPISAGCNFGTSARCTVDLDMPIPAIARTDLPSEQRSRSRTVDISHADQRGRINLACRGALCACQRWRRGAGIDVSQAL